MVALEDGTADTNTMVDTQNGIYTIYGSKIRDSNYRNGKGGHGIVSLKRAFELSSNVGIVKTIYEQYETKPEQFVDRLYNFGLANKLDLPIKGETSPNIPKKGDPNWSGITLPWMSFGYHVELTPLQMLTFYNAIANNGTMVKPRFVEEIRKHGRTVKVNEPIVLNPSICSKETLGKVQSMLEGVVKNGTATNIKSNLVSMAGKTGTCQQNYWKESTKEYQASFAGYFPADEPRYSCIVVINKPNYFMGYYGSRVAAPVFKAIAESIYLDTPKDCQSSNENIASLKTEPTTNPLEGRSSFPSFKGKSGSETISQLENQGYKVQVSGNGKVIWQYPPAGSEINTNTLVELKLG